MGFKVVRERKGTLPVIDIRKKEMQEIGKIAVASIIDNISTGQQSDGSSIKTNSIKWALQKQRRGWTHGGITKSVIAEKKRFISKGNWKIKARKGYVEVTPGSELSDLNTYVQKNGYTGWFAVSEKGWDAITHIIKKRIDEAFKKAARGR